MKIQDRQLFLVKAFLVCEAGDYGREGQDAEKWADERLQLIEEGLDKYDKGSNYLQINSLSNVGLLNRSLTLTPSPWNSKGMTTITLCTCGKLSCWGTITFPDGTKTGNKGVMPLFEEEDE